LKFGPTAQPAASNQAAAARHRLPRDLQIGFARHHANDFFITAPQTVLICPKELPATRQRTLSEKTNEPKNQERGGARLGDSRQSMRASATSLGNGSGAKSPEIKTAGGGVTSAAWT